ncbi:MAG: elongation factor G [Pseudomonadota bacterium]
MNKYQTSQIRNIAIVGAKGVGKTTVAEAILFTTKATSRIGKVDDGTTIVDYDPLEVERKQSIMSKFLVTEWDKHKLNFFDTPGYSDFIGEVVSSIAAADVVLMVVSATNGADIATKRLYSLVKEMNKPHAFFINKMDAERADYEKTFASIKEISSGAALFQLPNGQGASFNGVIDLLDPKTDIPADLADKTGSLKTELMETIAESDEKLLEKYLEQGEISEDEMKTALAKGIAKGNIYPVYMGSAMNGTGFETLLNAFINNLPSPDQLPVFKALRSDKTEVEVKCDPNGPVLAHIFKNTSDPGIGDIFFFKVLSGAVKSGADIYNSTQSTNERMGHLIITRGKERIEIDEAVAGDIAAVAKLKNTSINDTFSTKAHALLCKPIEFPKPVVPMALKPKSKKDQDKLGVALSKLVAVDPTLTYHIDKEFSETIITAMGEIQIDIMVKKLLDRYGVEVELTKPHIPYREKITKKSEKQGKHKKQSGGHGQYGDCWLRLEPLPPGSEFVFEDAIVGGSIPGRYIPAVEKGVRETMQKGVLAGYPVVDLKATVFDGSYHDVDSSDMSFQIAGALAFKAAMQDAAPELLEPIVDLEVYAPQDFMGDLSSDISSRRGRVSGMDNGVIKAKVPMAELYQYSATLKSITSGSGTYTMSFSHYESVPAHIAGKIIEEAKREKEEKNK